MSNPKLGDRASSDELDSVLCDSVRKKQKLQLPMAAFFRPKQPASPIEFKMKLLLYLKNGNFYILLCTGLNFEALMFLICKMKIKVIIYLKSIK